MAEARFEWRVLCLRRHSRMCFGLMVFNAIKEYPISCSGSVLATPAGLQRYAADMLRRMRQFNHRKCQRHDQRFHNYILYWPSRRARTHFYRFGWC